MIYNFLDKCVCGSLCNTFISVADVILSFAWPSDVVGA